MAQQQATPTDAPLDARKPNVVVQTADVRVVEYVLAPGVAHSWHHHTQITDTFYCLEGLIGVETREPASRRVLRVGETCKVPPNTVHHASNAGDATSRYLLVQAQGKYDYIKAE
ncbi:MAG: cupin domain-containing protein [Acetobacteraceae bacterium]